MTKLVIGLAVVVVVVLIIVILAARNMRAGHPEDAAQRSGGRGMSGRDRRDWRDEDRRDRAVRHPARDDRLGPRPDDQPRRAASRRADRHGSGQRSVDAPASRASGYGEPPYGLRPGPDSASRGSDGSRDRSRDGQMSSREAAGHGSRSGHHGAGSRGHESVRDRQRASVPGDRGTDRRDSDASPRLRAAEAPAEPRTRPGRSKRSDDSADWPSTEWDKLSDVDYWAELASDKPLTTTAQPPATPRPGQAGLEHDAQAGADRSAVTGHGPTSGHGAAGGVAPGSLGDPALPVRRRPELAAAPVPLPPPAPAQPRPAAAAGYYPDDPTIDQGGDARHGRRRIADSLADDPLTSPSFPRVRADDSRSFRSSRASGSAASREAAQNAPTQQFASYQSPAAPYGPPSAAALEREPRPAYPDSYPAGSGAHSRPPSGAVPAAGGPSSTAGRLHRRPAIHTGAMSAIRSATPSHRDQPRT